MATLYDAEGNAVEVPDVALEGGPKGLRDHAKSLEDDLKLTKEREAQQAQKLAQYERRDAFEAARSQAGDVAVTLEEVGDLPADQITPALLKAKAAEKAEREEQVLAEVAKASGFENVEEYQAALKAVADQKAAERQSLAAQAGITVGGSPTAPPPPREGTPGEEGVKTWEQARKSGKPMDVAQAEFVRAVIEKSVAGRSASAGA